MVRKWIDAGSITSNVSNEEYKEIDKLMKEVPNFNKKEGLRKIYQKEEYIILQAKRGFVVANTKKEFSKGHTHLNSYNMAKVIIDNCLRSKRPRTNSIYLIDSHIRLTKNEAYTKYLIEIKEAINRREGVKYVNVNSKKVSK